MFAFGLVELLVLPVLAILVLYLVVRLAVKHGSQDAQRERGADEERRRLARAIEDSRNSGV